MLRRFLFAPLNAFCFLPAGGFDKSGGGHASLSAFTDRDRDLQQSTGTVAGRENTGQIGRLGIRFDGDRAPVIFQAELQREIESRSRSFGDKDAINAELIAITKCQ